MCFWLCLDFACECKDNVRDKVCGCEHLVCLEIHLLHASHLQVNVDVCGRVYFSWMCMMFVNNNKSNFVFFCQTAFACFLELHDFFNKFVENMNEFGRFWKEFDEFWKWMMNSNMSNSSNSMECLRWKWKRIFFSPRPFQDGTAKRRRHSTVHVHDK